MGFRLNGWATIWDIEEGKGNTMKVRLSTSRKNKETGEYEQDFSGFCTFIGNAKAKAEKLKPKDRIKLGDVDVTTWYNKEKNTGYITYKVFDFDVPGDSDDSETSAQNAKGAKKSSGLEDDMAADGDVNEDDLPF